LLLLGAKPLINETTAHISTLRCAAQNNYSFTSELWECFTG
jgi:hypothetical protein